MPLYTMITAVFIANVMTAIFLWGMSRAHRLKEDKDITWPIFWAVITPLGFVILSVIASDLPLPFLAEAASQ